MIIYGDQSSLKALHVGIKPLLQMTDMKLLFNIKLSHTKEWKNNKLGITSLLLGRIHLTNQSKVFFKDQQ